MEPLISHADKNEYSFIGVWVEKKTFGAAWSYCTSASSCHSFALTFNREMSIETAKVQRAFLLILWTQMHVLVGWKWEINDIGTNLADTSVPLSDRHLFLLASSVKVPLWWAYYFGPSLLPGQVLAGVAVYLRCLPASRALITWWEPSPAVLLYHTEPTSCPWVRNVAVPRELPRLFGSFHRRRTAQRRSCFSATRKSQGTSLKTIDVKLEKESGNTE